MQSLQTSFGFIVMCVWFQIFEEVGVEEGAEEVDVVSEICWYHSGKISWRPL